MSEDRCRTGPKYITLDLEKFRQEEQEAVDFLVDKARKETKDKRLVDIASRIHIPWEQAELATTVSGSKEYHNLVMDTMSEMMLYVARALIERADKSP